MRPLAYSLKAQARVFLTPEAPRDFLTDGAANRLTAPSRRIALARVWRKAGGGVRMLTAFRANGVDALNLPSAHIRLAEGAVSLISGCRAGADMIAGTVASLCGRRAPSPCRPLFAESIVRCGGYNYRESYDGGAPIALQAVPCLSRCAFTLVLCRSRRRFIFSRCGGITHLPKPHAGRCISYNET